MSKYYYIYLITYLVYTDVAYDVGVTLNALRNARDGTNIMYLSDYTLYVRCRLKTQFT